MDFMNLRLNRLAHQHRGIAQWKCSDRNPMRELKKTAKALKSPVDNAVSGNEMSATVIAFDPPFTRAILLPCSVFPPRGCVQVAIISMSPYSVLWLLGLRWVSDSARLVVPSCSAVMLTR